MTWMTRPAMLRRASALLSAAVLVALAAGCGNGLETSAAGSAVPAPTTPSTRATSTGAGNASGSPSADDQSAADSSSSPSTADSTTAGDGSDGQSAGGAANSTSPGRPTCALGHLDIGVKTADGGGAAGSVYVLLTFTNTGSQTCDLYGYPGVAFVGDHNGTQLGAAATRSSNGRPAVVRLASGDATTALLQIVNAGNFDAKACAPTTSDGFRVYPPASSTAAYVPFRTQACQRTGVHQLEASPVGTSG